MSMHYSIMSFTSCRMVNASFIKFLFDAFLHLQKPIPRLVYLSIEIPMQSIIIAFRIFKIFNSGLFVRLIFLSSDCIWSKNDFFISKIIKMMHSEFIFGFRMSKNPKIRYFIPKNSQTTVFKISTNQNPVFTFRILVTISFRHGLLACAKGSSMLLVLFIAHFSLYYRTV